ncbi:hypothetical protein [Streptomyces sp. CA-251247]|uniref:hypothetical protein n=1 Tax=Streptomyces sp. CA-251247 TaxID=3240062 RepID=UPI003D8FDD20
MNSFEVVDAAWVALRRCVPTPRRRAVGAQSADSAVIDLLLALQKEATLVVAAPSRPLQNLLATAPSPVLSSLSLGEALDLVGT